MNKPIPIGISDFKKIIDEDFTYVDKSLFIQEIIEKGIEVALFPRPRRFGKTLNLSMLRYFFEKTPGDTSYLFKNLNIWKIVKYRQLQGQYPIIFLTLKGIKSSSWATAFEALGALIAKEFKRHRYLLNGDLLSPEEKEEFHTILRKRASQATLETSLLNLSEWLHLFHNKKVIVLIDEYDAPVHAAFAGGYYQDLIEFLGNFLTHGLKDTVCLERAILTGILPITKESIFSGLNNVGTFTVLDPEFEDKFGLVESEVKALLNQYGLKERLHEVTEWYNGYQMGTCPHIYNPWSVLYYIYKKGSLDAYWVNTSDNALINQLITKADSDFKADIEHLLNGGVVKKTIDPGIVFSELENNTDVLWSLLLFSGYLSLDTPYIPLQYCHLRIPNKEVSRVFRLCL